MVGEKRSNGDLADDSLVRVWVDSTKIEIESRTHKLTPDYDNRQYSVRRILSSSPPQSSFSRQAIYARGVFLLGDKKFGLLSKVPGDTQNKVLLLPLHKHTFCVSFVFNTFFVIDDRKTIFMKI